MMDHVKGGEVGELLPQHEEERVEEVHELGDEVPPGHVQRCQPSVASQRDNFRDEVPPGYVQGGKPSIAN